MINASQVINRGVSVKYTAASDLPHHRPFNILGRQMVLRLPRGGNLGGGGYQDVPVFGKVCPPDGILSDAAQNREFVVVRAVDYLADYGRVLKMLLYDGGDLLVGGKF